MPWVVVRFDPPSEINAAGIGYYCAGGLFGFGIGCAASVTGIQRLGAATSVPLEGIVYPLTAVVTAVIVLGERIRLPYRYWEPPRSSWECGWSRDRLPGPEPGVSPKRSPQVRTGRPGI